MRRPPDLPSGTKYDILKLLIRQELAADDLAASLGVSGAAVRQHLDTLRALGLVERRKVVTQPSRPTYLYRLSPDGQRAFPKRYELLLALVIESILDRHGERGVAEVVAAAAERLAARVKGRFASADERRRWDLLLGWLEEELAWQADAREEGDGWRRVVIHQCPFQDVSRDHPAVCGVFFRTLVEALYGAVPVEHRPEPPPACCSLRIAAALPPSRPA
ncbi:MAG TPA: ArsR family transcriptional regulator [Thermodesulfobacteriota bacterium]